MSEDDDINALNWMDRQPPYEGIGRVIIEGSSVEYELRMLGENKEATWSKWLTANPSDLVARLGTCGVDSDLLDRTSQALGRRNLVAHGSWLNLIDRGEVIVKQDRASGDFKGLVVTSEKLLTWATELAGIAQELRSLQDPPSR